MCVLVLLLQQHLEVDHLLDGGEADKALQGWVAVEEGQVIVTGRGGNGVSRARGGGGGGAAAAAVAARVEEGVVGIVGPLVGTAVVLRKQK